MYPKQPPITKIMMGLAWIRPNTMIPLSQCLSSEGIVPDACRVVESAQNDPMILVTWVPLVLLSLVAGHAFGNRVAVPSLSDPVILSRFLFVIPLLALAEIVVERSLGVQARQFLASGAVPAGEAIKLDTAKAEALRLRDSVVAEAVILVLAVTIAIVARLVVRLGPGESTWERSGTGDHARRLVVRPGEPADPALFPLRDQVNRREFGDS